MATQTQGGVKALDAVLILTKLFEQNGCGGFVTEYLFARPRRYRFDFCWVAEKTAVEYEGGAGTRGWHTSVGRFMSDARKYTLAALNGWTVLRYTCADMDEPARILAEVKQALGRE